MVTIKRVSIGGNTAKWGLKRFYSRKSLMQYLCQNTQFKVGK